MLSFFFCLFFNTSMELFFFTSGPNTNPSWHPVVRLPQEHVFLVWGIMTLGSRGTRVPSLQAVSSGRGIDCLWEQQHAGSKRLCWCFFPAWESVLRFSQVPVEPSQLDHGKTNGSIIVLVCVCLFVCVYLSFSTLASCVNYLRTL